MPDFGPGSENRTGGQLKDGMSAEADGQPERPHIRPELSHPQIAIEEYGVDVDRHEKGVNCLAGHNPESGKFFQMCDIEETGSALRTGTGKPNLVGQSGRLVRILERIRRHYQSGRR